MYNFCMNAAVNEIFYSIQGEGSFLGYPAVFVRFSGCNLSCDFCDTKYANDNFTYFGIDELHKKVSEFNTKRVIFTGGEPALKDEFMAEYMSRYDDYSYLLETNGTIFVEKSIKYFEHIVISPKFFSLNYSVIEKYINSEKSKEFKFVVKDESDIEKVEQLDKKFNFQTIVLQPLFVNGEKIEEYAKRAERLIAVFKESFLSLKNTRLILQTHKIIYGERRGV